MPRGRSVRDLPRIARCRDGDGRCGAPRAARTPQHEPSRARDARPSGGVSHGIKRPRSPPGARLDRAGCRSKQDRVALDPPCTQPMLESPDPSPTLVPFLGDQAAGVAPGRKAGSGCGQKRGQVEAHSRRVHDSFFDQVHCRFVDQRFRVNGADLGHRLAAMRDKDCFAAPHLGEEGAEAILRLTDTGSLHIADIARLKWLLDNARTARNFRRSPVHASFHTCGKPNGSGSALGARCRLCLRAAHLLSGRSQWT